MPCGFSRPFEPPCSCATNGLLAFPGLGQTWRYPVAVSAVRSASPSASAAAIASAAVIVPRLAACGDGFGHVFAWCVSIRWL